MDELKSDTLDAPTRPAADYPNDELAARDDRRFVPGRFTRPDDSDKSPEANERRRLHDVFGDSPYFEGALVTIWRNIFGTSEPFPQSPVYEREGVTETQRDRDNRRGVDFGNGEQSGGKAAG